MTTEEVRAVELSEQRHALLDLDPDSIPGSMHTGPFTETEPHLYGSLICLEKAV